MFGLNYNCRLIRLGFSFFISLTCYNIALANKTKGKKKEVAVVSPIVQKNLTQMVLMPLAKLICSMT